MAALQAPLQKGRAVVANVLHVSVLAARSHGVALRRRRCSREIAAKRCSPSRNPNAAVQQSLEKPFESSRLSRGELHHDRRTLYTFPSKRALLGGVSSGPLSCPSPPHPIIRPFFSQVAAQGLGVSPSEMSTDCNDGRKKKTGGGTGRWGGGTNTPPTRQHRNNKKKKGGGGETPGPHRSNVRSSVGPTRGTCQPQHRANDDRTSDGARVNVGSTQVKRQVEFGTHAARNTGPTTIERWAVRL